MSVLWGRPAAVPCNARQTRVHDTHSRATQDNVSPVSDPKRTATAVAVLAAVLVLVPMAPEVAASIGLGKVDPFF